MNGFQHMIVYFEYEKCNNFVYETKGIFPLFHYVTSPFDLSNLIENVVARSARHFFQQIFRLVSKR